MGEQEHIIKKMIVNEIASTKGISRYIYTFKIPFRIRLCDKILEYFFKKTNN
jgi:hypothetical protein